MHSCRCCVLLVVLAARIWERNAEVAVQMLRAKWNRRWPKAWLQCLQRSPGMSFGNSVHARYSWRAMRWDRWLGLGHGLVFLLWVKKIRVQGMMDHETITLP